MDGEQNGNTRGPLPLHSSSLFSMSIVVHVRSKRECSVRYISRLYLVNFTRELRRNKDFTRPRAFAIFTFLREKLSSQISRFSRKSVGFFHGSGPCASRAGWISRNPSDETLVRIRRLRVVRVKNVRAHTPHEDERADGRRHSSRRTFGMNAGLFRRSTMLLLTCALRSPSCLV